MSLLKELANIEDVKALPIMEALEESVRTLNLTSKGGLQKAVGGAKEFFTKNPVLAASAAAMAVSAFASYEQNKRNTIKLHAKSPYEKSMITSIVDALQKDGKFKVHKIKFENGGKTWIIKRV